ncbi:transcription antitermination protein NusB [Brachybacterium hainanense]|uniref:Transcription antitermination protein NusB n=1 Tax=Brachybacterium hainanense TaxID=1541174 RepID=A0ABV6RG63_9MICO
MTDSSAAPAGKGPDLPLPFRETDGEVAFERTVPARTDRLSARTRERIRAIDVVFEADARQLPVLEVLAQRIGRTAAQTPLPDRSRELVRLYAQHAEDIDDQLATHSRDWPLHRMPAVDRAALRLGAAEVLHGTQAEDRGPVIGEYTKIVSELSTDDSPRFVNGLLQRLADVQGLLS